jgi:hypothetical protein
LRVDIPFLVGAVDAKRDDTGNEVAKEGESLLTEIEMVDISKDEGERFEEELKESKTYVSELRAPDNQASRTHIEQCVNEAQID